MVEVTTKGKAVEDVVVDKAIIGSKVFAKNGKELGVVKELYINPKDLNVKAVNIYKSPFKFDHFISKEYIDTLGPDGVILNIIPLEDLIGKKVLDSNGRKIGKVKDFDKLEQTNKMISLNVTEGLTGDNYIIKSTEIK
jgi:sporulation protein YlmC with PRC-barrel domain